MSKLDAETFSLLFLDKFTATALACATAYDAEQARNFVFLSPSRGHDEPLK